MSTSSEYRLVSWRKSSYSNGDGGACLEVADSWGDIVPVRDSKLPDSPVLTFPTPAWHTFVTTLGTQPRTP